MKISNIYYSPWFPRFFYKKFDGGKDSGVIGYFLIEWKKVFSIGILRFENGSREAYHSHAFNAITWWLSGEVCEERLKEKYTDYKIFKPSFKPKITYRNNIHKVISNKTTYALTFRGPWNDTWIEVKNGKKITLTHGRVVVY